MLDQPELPARQNIQRDGLTPQPYRPMRLSCTALIGYLLGAAVSDRYNFCRSTKPLTSIGVTVQVLDAPAASRVKHVPGSQAYRQCAKPALQIADRPPGGKCRNRQRPREQGSGRATHAGTSQPPGKCK